MKELIIKEIVDIKEKEKISREILNDLPKTKGIFSLEMAVREKIKIAKKTK